ncbi:ADP-ribose pyrophosphatase, partial [Candidatus Gastranaerophilus sp. (ex Termes propinquus)]
KTLRPPLRAEGAGEFNIELPAGLVGDVDKNETPLEAAGKELLEETGLKAGRFEVMTRKLSSSGGCTSECATVVLAYVEDTTLHKVPEDDEGVIVERVEVPLNEIPAWLLKMEYEGNTIGAQTLAGLFYLWQAKGVLK